jgi:glycosyltransferase involved in cell wall biosynthesis
MRVLQVIPSLGVGGAERIAALLALHLQRSGHCVAVVSMYDPLGTWIEGDLRSAEVPLHFLGKQPGLDLRMIRRMGAVIRGFRPDVVHTHMHTLKYALPAAFAVRCGIVHTLHNLAEHEADSPSRLIQYAAFRSGVVPVAIGAAVAESVQRVYGLPPGHVIPNGIPVAEYAPPPNAREDVRASLLIPPDAPTFVSIGRLELQKDTRRLVTAMASRCMRAVGAHLLLAGQGTLRGTLERQALDLGVADRVHFLGIRADVPRVLAAADAFVLASRYEGNPLTVLEAMAAGKPVVATAVGCVPELVVNGTGRLVALGDESALEMAMRELASDMVLARSRGAAAARVARERFDASVMGRAYERLYGEST